VLGASNDVAPSSEECWMRFVVYSGTDNKESAERYDSADLALAAISAHSAERRSNVRIFRDNGAPVSLAELQALAEMENESDDA
jgi:hypothetical protein